MTRNLVVGQGVGRSALAVALSAAFDGLLSWRLGWSWTLPAYLLVGPAIAVVSVVDATERRVPDRVLLPTGVTGIGLLVAASGAGGQWAAVVRALLAALVLGGFYLGIAVASGGGLGLGDCKLAVLLGFFLGWLGWSLLPLATLATFGAAALFVGARWVARWGPDRRGSIPLAPFMVAGFLLALLLLG